MCCAAAVVYFAAEIITTNHPLLSVVFYLVFPLLIFCFHLSIVGTPNRARRGESVRGCFVSQNSSVTEAPSDEVEPEPEPEADDEIEPARVTQ